MRSLLSRLPKGVSVSFTPFENQHCVFLGVMLEAWKFQKSTYTPSETICGLSLRDSLHLREDTLRWGVLREREKFSCPARREKKLSCSSRRFIRKGAE